MTQRFDDAGAPASGPAGVTEWDFHAIVFGTAAASAAPRTEGARTAASVAAASDVVAPPSAADPAARSAELDPDAAPASRPAPRRSPAPAPAGHRFDRLESPPAVFAAVRAASPVDPEQPVRPRRDESEQSAPATRPVPIVSAAASPAEIEIATRPAAPRPNHDPHWLLRLLDGSEHPLDGTVVLGRAPRAGAGEGRITVPDEQSGVSRTHARMSLRGGLLTVEDLGSTNGTYLVDEAGVETRCPPHEPMPVPLGWGVDLANVPLVLWAPGR